MDRGFEEQQPSFGADNPQPDFEGEAIPSGELTEEDFRSTSEVSDSSRNIRVMVSISTDALEAFVTIRTPPRTPVPREMVDEALRNEGITYGLDEEKIDQLCQRNGTRGHPVVVAQGIRPGTGVHGRIDYHFEVDPRPKTVPTGDGRVDYRETGVIQQVKEGDLLAVRTPAQRGEEGMSVTGIPIKGKSGKEAVLMRGPGTTFVDEDKLELHAALSGCAKLHKNGEVEVTGEFIVEGDVDYSTGNIRFDGTVIVRGDVKSGFVVAATKDIEIKGIVEDARIHCGGNLLVRGGFVGSGKGVCKVVGETHIRFLENQTVFGNGDVYIAEEIVHGNVVSGGTVYVKFGKGAIIGGQVIAKKAIEAKILGNIHYLKTKLQVAKVPRIDEMLDSIEKVLDVRESMRDRIQTAVNYFVEQKYKSEGISSENEAHLTNLYRFLGNYDKWLSKLAEKQEALLVERRKLDKEAYVKAEHQMHPGVVIEFDNMIKQIDHEQSRVALKLVDGNLQLVRPTGYEGEFRPVAEEQGAETQATKNTAKPSGKAGRKSAGGRAGGRSKR